MTHPAVVREALLLEAREQRSPNGPNREESQGDGASGEGRETERGGLLRTKTRMMRTSRLFLHID